MKRLGWFLAALRPILSFGSRHRDRLGWETLVDTIGLVSLKSKAWVESPFHIIRFHSRSSEPIDLSPGGKLQELQTERSEKERVVNEKSLAWPARKKVWYNI